MSAQVRGKHSVDCNLAEAKQLIGEFKAIVNERDSLKQENNHLKNEINKQEKTVVEDQPEKQEAKNTSQSSTDFTGILDGGKF